MVETTVHDVVSIEFSKTQRFETESVFFSRNIEITYIDYLDKKQVLTIMVFAKHRDNLDKIGGVVK